MCICGCACVFFVCFCFCFCSCFFFGGGGGGGCFFLKGLGKLWFVGCSVLVKKIHLFPCHSPSCLACCCSSHSRFTSWPRLHCQNVHGQCRVERIGVQSVKHTKLTKKCELTVCCACANIVPIPPIQFYSEQALMKTQALYYYFLWAYFYYSVRSHSELKTIWHWQPEAQMHFCSALII